MSDAKTILSAFQINEGEGFQLLYNYCYRSLVYFADSIVDDPEAAEDIVQEVFVDFWIHKRHLYISGSIVDYMYKCVRFTSLRYLKKQKKQQRVYTSFAAEREEEETAFEDLETDRLEFLFSIIDKLPEERRKIFLMVSVKNMKYQEVADVLGISVNTVKTQLVRSIRFLREQINNDLFFTLFFFLLEKKRV